MFISKETLPEVIIASSTTKKRIIKTSVLVEDGEILVLGGLIDDTMRDTWARGMGNSAKTWAAELDSRGQPGTVVLQLYMDAMRKLGAKPMRDWDKE